jgi:hypothetical protein
MGCCLLQSMLGWAGQSRLKEQMFFPPATTRVERIAILKWRRKRKRNLELLPSISTNSLSTANIYKIPDLIPPMQFLWYLLLFIGIEWCSTLKMVKPFTFKISYDCEYEDINEKHLIHLEWNCMKLRIVQAIQ